MSRELSDIQIERLLDSLDGSGSDSEWTAADELREALGSDLPAYLFSRYLVARRSAIRSSCVYHAMRYARESENALELGVAAIQDNSKVVRYRGCMLLAYSLQKHTLPKLRALIDSIHANSRNDLLAAIDAIESQNHHYFIDRDHTGDMNLNIG
ncbi:MAG: hypothetical protein DRR42_09050 [Gammaproteobacteria bacterium]|nr:MAG: hypothetical protein DRR42_09050 [Gammaproteobacteria bacterium]